jgi:hypothetical protein
MKRQTNNWLILLVRADAKTGQRRLFIPKSDETLKDGDYVIVKKVKAK